MELKTRQSEVPSYLRVKTTPLSENEAGLTAHLSFHSRGDLGSLYKLKMCCATEFGCSLCTCSIHFR